MVNMQLPDSGIIELDPAEMPLPQRLALVNARARERSVFAAFFALDARLARLVTGIAEPILGQMRLAWWRDELAKKPRDRPKGDPVLDAISVSWSGNTTSLVSLVDGWEALIASEGGERRAAVLFAEGRAAAFAGLARHAGSRSDEADVSRAAKRWALVDLAENSTTLERRDAAMIEASALGDEAIALDRAMRPLAVLDGLARRAIRRGNPQLLGDRFSPLAALRLGLFGR